MGLPLPHSQYERLISTSSEFVVQLVTPERFELSTYRLEVSCSIQLSYGAKPFHCTRLGPPAGQIHEAWSVRASDMARVIAGTVMPYLSSRVVLGTRSLNSLAAPKARV